MRQFLARKFVLHYLYRRQQEHLRRYRQMCCYAFDHISRHIAIDGRYEREEIDFILDRFRERIAGRTVLDIGANIGNHTLAFAEAGARVIALEPHPITFELLRLNTRSQSNVTALNVGASDRSARLKAVAPAGNAGGCSIGDGPGEEVELEVQPVDELAELNEVVLVKIDVEGHEEQALRGMERLLREQAPLIVFEQNPEMIADGTSASVRLLRRFGYGHFYSLEKRNPWRFPFGRGGHVAEALLLGIPPLEAYLSPVSGLEQREYPCLVASTDPLL
jgi:FkbM family methyltransferase